MCWRAVKQKSNQNWGGGGGGWRKHELIHTSITTSKALNPRDSYRMNTFSRGSRQLVILEENMCNLEGATRGLCPRVRKSDPNFSVKWAASWQNQQCGMRAQQRLRSAWASAQSDQSSLSAWRELGSWAQRRLWSDWADAQADLSLRWAHNHFVGFVMRQLNW